jgi:hypothetical protein
MAKKSGKIVDTLKRIFNIDQVTKVDIEIADKSYRSLTDIDVKNFAKEVFVKNKSSNRNIDYMQIPSMIEPISRDLMNRRTDHEKLIALAPEIGQAASILIPSILTPNDFAKNIFSVVINTENESQEVLTEIVELLNNHFGEELDFSIKLSAWAEEAMFKVGSKAIMLLPTKTIQIVRNLTGSTEELIGAATSLINEINGSLEHISQTRADDIGKFMKDDSTILDRVVSTFSVHGYLDEQAKNGDQSRAIKKITDYIHNGIPSVAKYLANNKMIRVTTDVRSMILPKLGNMAAMEAIDSRILKALGEDPTPIRRDTSDGISKLKDVDTQYSYGYIPYLDLGDIVAHADPSSYPAMIELPSESVVPIAIEGSPSNHIGYFILINENGTPVSIDSEPGVYDEESNSGTQRINDVYTAFYGNSQSLQNRMSSEAKAEILNSVYDSYLRGLMTSKLDNMGFNKYKINLTNDMSRVMFFRLLKNLETRILYVPKRLMFYLAFDYYPDGTGKSKVDAIKFPLSLKITLIIVRLISLIESSINRRKLSITLDPNIGNPLEILRTVKKEMTKNKMYGISYDPSTIIKSVLDKELTIIPSRIPGVEEFNLTDENNNVDYPRPDDAILDEINNMYMLSLGVPPSAMNRLSEDEFSRSVAANNIFFSNQLKGHQKPICSFMTSLITTYIGFSTKLQDKIGEILKGNSDDNADNKLSIKERVKGVINSIKFTLPNPNLAQDKSAFEEIKDYIEIVDTVLNNLISDDITSDADLQSVVKTIRAEIKKRILEDHIKNNNILSGINFGNIGDIDISTMIGDTQRLKNTKAALDGIVSKFSTEGGEAEEPTGTSTW